jgi:hypothetical protein
LNNAKKPLATVSLEKFLGLFTGSDPSSLPEGGSPLCFNCDFQVGGVLPRPGLLSEYSGATDAYAGNGVDAGGALAWTSPFNIAGAPVGVYTTNTLASNQSSNPLLTTDYGFSIPAAASVQSLIIELTGGVGGFGSGDLVISAFILFGGVVIFDIPLSVLASPDGTTDSTFTFTITNAQAAMAFTPTIVNAPSFGAAFIVSNSTGITRTVRLAGAQIQVVVGGIGPGLNFNYIKTFAQTDGEVITLALDSSGTIWEEDVTNNPGTLTPMTPGSSSPQTISSYASSVADSGTGGSAWTNPGSAEGSPDGEYAFSPTAASGSSNTNFLLATGYVLNAVPAGATILGVAVTVMGRIVFPTEAPPTPTMTATLLNNGATIGASQTTNFTPGAALGDNEFSVTFGGPSILWGANLSLATVVSTTFGVQLQGSVTNIPVAGFLEIDSIQILVTAIVGSQTIQPNSFAESVTVDDREFIAFSNLLNGTDIPRTFDGENFPRLSQVGPGAPPTAATTTTASVISSITQIIAFPLPVDPHSWLLISASPSDIGSFGAPATPGNVMTIVLPTATIIGQGLGLTQTYLLAGMNIILSGFPTLGGFVVNNDPTGVLAPPFYTVTSVGSPIPGQESYDALTFTVSFTTFYNKETPAGCTFQATEATMTTAAQVPNLEVGDRFQIASTGGAPPAGYDGTWTVDQTPNASQLEIVSTVLNNNIATYGFNLISGVAPVAGQAVTVTSTLNGNGIFNVTNAVISSVSTGTFSLQINSPSNVASAAEDGSGLIFGTIFQFDPLAIVGNKSGVGTIVTVGIIAAGIRGICYSFLTDNDYITAPSPIFTYDVIAGAETLVVSNLLPGPPNVVARIVHLTAGNGGNFYNIPVPVTVLSNGADVVNTATYLLDNTSTSISLSFSDEVLTGATEIDVPGNNLFETIELGAPLALIPYAGRIFALGEQNKVQNLLNWSFDGGIGVNSATSAGGGTGIVQTYPAGWTPGILAQVSTPSSTPLALDGVLTTIGEVNGQLSPSTTLSMTLTPTTSHDWAFALFQPASFPAQNGVPVTLTESGWETLENSLSCWIFTLELNSTAPVTAQGLLPNATSWAGIMFLLTLEPGVPLVNTGVEPGIAQARQFIFVGSNPLVLAFLNNTTAGNGILVFVAGQPHTDSAVTGTVIDSDGNIYTQIATSQNGVGQDVNSHTVGEFVGAWWCPNIKGGVKTQITWTETSGDLYLGFYNTFQMIEVHQNAPIPVTNNTIYGGSVVTSPIFGSAYQIVAFGTSAAPSGAVGVITQPAYQDEFEVPIINASTTYSVRVTLETVGGGSAGDLVIDLFSPSINRVLGAFSLALSGTTGQMAIYTGTLLTKVLAPVPADLILRVYLNGVVGTWTATIDRLEIFPTLEPNLSGQVLGSYQGNFEAFDRVNGVVETDVQNQQPNKSAFTLFDTLYVVKTGSLVSTQDNKTTEPSQWSTPRVISNVVGTTSIYGVAGVNDQDSGEEWAIIAGQPGAFVFGGGDPVKITEEIQELWNLINWQYGHTLWVTNDITNRRILIGVPVKTFTIVNGVTVQNPWIPTGLVQGNGNPTTPNVVIALNYKFLTTGAELGGRAEIHVSAFGGKLLSVDMARKWNIWSIQSPCAGLITRPDGTQQTFFGNSEGTSKIYQLTPGLLEDDGEAFWQLWTSHGWPTPEQEQQFQLGAFRKVYEYMSLLLGGTGDLAITVYPDSLGSPYAHQLLPNLILPVTTSGDAELPVQEAGNRLFIQFSCNAVGSGFTLARIVMAMRSDPWSPIRGSNT